MPEAFIYDHVRTPRGKGKSDGALHEVTALALATAPLKALKERNNLKEDTVDDVVIIASKAGAPDDPQWFRNLVANPEVVVEVGTERYAATARVAEGEERDRLYRAQADLMPNFDDYAAKTSRRIPVVVLERR